MQSPIIPPKSQFYNTENNEFCDFAFDLSMDLDLKSICFFAATGFFLGDTTYFNGLKVAKPATSYTMEGNKISHQNTSWEWHYSPREISLKQAIEEFAHLFDRITKEKIAGKKVILPLSGGLDSRSQAAVLGKNDQVAAYSYEFEDGINENKYGRAIAGVQNFQYSGLKIPRSYLWEKIEKLAKLNHCLSDFTHQRQIAVEDQYGSMGDLFFLGHWGDVLFDDMAVEEGLNEEQVLEVLLKKILKKGGLELGKALWQAWGLAGDFGEALKEKLSELLSAIHIDNTNARIRAFKSLYWAPRWTSTNLCVFQHYHNVFLPYYEDEMCRFICTIPERHLAARQIQIGYIKMVAPELARIPWQSYDPCNLNNYKNYYSAYYLPIRIWRNLKRNVDHKLLGKSKLITRNWEIQFCGQQNEEQLKKYLFAVDPFSSWIPKELTDAFYRKFVEEDDVFYSHPVSMLLTLSLFCKLRAGI
ncbi:hypothetical protein QQ020_05240 [Fulvivirgaceae bacterium BMA12]|uniref:Asparagine synthase n=1 Tax=Agaribacillus aureus TaxID=3051825 RepID=A0ABT8L180_9BACT|nr:hypothetical protein [Fulvivirgaceae bacterium BMA12]